MTLTQLGAFVLVARLGSVRAAATALGVSEPAVSQALAALRRHLGDDLLLRTGTGMTLTEGGQRLVPIASQMVNLAADAEAAVRRAQGAPDRLRVVTEPVLAEYVTPGLVEAFAARGHGVEATVGVASRAEIPALLHERLADVAIGPNLSGIIDGLDSVAVMRCRQVVVAAPDLLASSRGRLAECLWLTDPSAGDPQSDTAGMLASLRVPAQRVRVYPSQAAAWNAAVAGEGLAPALLHLVQPELVRGVLRVVDGQDAGRDVEWYVTTLSLGRRPAVATSLRQFVTSPTAMRLMHTPGRGVEPSRFRPPVYVTIWS